MGAVVLFFCGIGNYCVFQESTKKYIVSKCRNDSNYVVRMVCDRECKKHELKNGYSMDSGLVEAER